MASHSYTFRRFVIICMILFFGHSMVFCATNKPFVSNTAQLEDSTFAEWIKPFKDADEGVFYFRKSFELKSVLSNFIIHISADNKYVLNVNGKQIARGPAIGDLSAWNYETIDLAPYLQVGKNIIAVKVVNMGKKRPARQISNTTALIIQGNSSIEQIINTDASWLTSKDSGYYFVKMKSDIVGGGYIAGGTDSVVLNGRFNKWTEIQYDDSDWTHPIELGKGNHLGLNTWVGTPWFLKESKLAAMQPEKQKIKQLLSVTGANVKFENKSEKFQVSIPANSQVEMLFDNEILTVGYPQLHVSGGKNTKIKIQYQEALFDSLGNKTHRNKWQNMIMKGYYDVFVLDGSQKVFEPVSTRTFRYIKMTINTGNEALQIDDFYNNFSVYPFQLKAKFTSDNKLLSDIWNISWRTSQLCASDTYMDCPYYEQLQYIGDTRLQALTSLYVTDDDKLVRNAIEQFNNSMQPMGLTRSSYPCAGIQIIPPFSLVYINMIHDYYKLRDDSVFIKQFVPGMKFILEWFVGKIGKNGMLGSLPYWNFVDGVPQFINGSPPGVTEGSSAQITIQLAHALDNAVDIFQYLGLDCDVTRYKAISDSLKISTLKLCFDENKQLIAETPDKQLFSQHTNSMAILSNMFDSTLTKSVANKIITDTTLVQTTMYFDFYVFQALKKADLGDQILPSMKKWKFFLDNGFTTLPEHGIESRSDCHAWSAHPMFDFLNITCGISSLSAGFKIVEIRPQIGNLNKFEACFPHPEGEIKVTLKKSKLKTVFTVDFPKNTKGFFIFDNKKYSINQGNNVYEFNRIVNPKLPRFGVVPFNK